LWVKATKATAPELPCKPALLLLLLLLLLRGRASRQLRDGLTTHIMKTTVG
jgi:hypothetical protein